MTKRIGFVIAAVIGTLVIFCSAAQAQDGHEMPHANAEKEQPAAAQKHDISGVWAGIAVPQLEPAPAMTPWGQKVFDERRAIRGDASVVVGVGNDPMGTCDPIGFPRMVLQQIRGFEFEPTPHKMLELFQYQRVWRDIWTDGRPLPKDVGGSSPNSPDPRWYGYSVGHWADDYTFVVETTGLDERSWVDEFGDPHSINAHVEERYRRVNHDTLELTVTIDDPKAYTKPFEIMKHDFKWNPKQTFEEQMCVPSEAQAYMRLIANPAAGIKQK